MAMAMAEANWSELPTDLLNLISQRFDNDLDLIRFRSVCCNWWRSSSISNHHHHSLPFKLQHFISKSPPCSLSKHILLLIKPPPPQKQDQETLQPWLIRISKNAYGETQLFHPLRDNPNIYHFPYDLDFNKLSVIHLGNDFVMYNYGEDSTILQLRSSFPFV
ncbi:F-box protein [Trifolium medium]|uniref:F-box protein n=1 Tax=Trifolium medium TaxID=97028 RepID=A0A392N976_9FABA|nr:F-box protein [Trifolium medium]